MQKDSNPKYPQKPLMPFLLEKDLAELEELTDEQIGFTAIHQGLGFKMGSGAELAGTTAVAKPAILKTENVVTEKLAHISEAGVSFFTRSSAMFLDILLLSAPFALILQIFLGSTFIRIFKESGLDLFLFICAYFWTYFVLSESLGGQSLGKMILKLRVVEDDKYQKAIGFKIALFRSICLVFSLLPFGLGIWMAFWDKKARQWHDKASNSIIRKTN